MKNKTVLTLCLVGALSAALSGCGSSGSGSGTTTNIPGTSATASTGLSYTDPTDTTHWRLVQDASSTATRVVLNLVGPDNAVARGVGFNLSKGQCINFGTFPTGAYALNTKVFQLKAVNVDILPYAGTPADPELFASAPINGGAQLSTGIFQKDRTHPAVAVNQPLVQIAIDLATQATTGCNKGTVVALSVVKAKIIPDDIGGMDFQTTYTSIQKGKMATIAIDVGTLTTQ